MKRLAALGFIFCALLGVQLHAQTYYFDITNGNDTIGDGTSGNPFKTATKAAALQNVNNGINFVFKKGLYNQSTLNLTKSGPAVNNPFVWSVFDTNTAPSNVIFTNGSGDVMQWTSISNMCVQGIHFKGAPVSGGSQDSCIRLIVDVSSYAGLSWIANEFEQKLFGVFGYCSSSANQANQQGTLNPLILSNVFHDMTCSAFYLRDGQSYFGSTVCPQKNRGGLIKGNIVYNITGNSTIDECTGFHIQANTNWLITLNTLTNIGSGSSRPSSGGPAVIIFTFTDSSTVESNVVGNIFWNSVSHQDGVGLNPGPAARNTKWRHNYVFNCDGGGILDNVQDGFNWGGNNEYSANVIVNCGRKLAQGAVEFNGQIGSTPINNKLFNNQIVCQTDGASGIHIGNDGPHQVFNNIVITTNGFSVNLSRTTPLSTLDYNCYTNLSSANVTFLRNGVTSTGITAWRTASSQDAHSIQQNPPLRNGGVTIALAAWPTMLTLTNYMPVAAANVLSLGDTPTHYGATMPAFDASGTEFIPGVFPMGSYGGQVSDPLIVNPPQSITVYDNQTAAFAVTATGTALSYQWKKNGSNVGANQSTYSFTAATANNNDTVLVVVSGSGPQSPVTSSTATLTVSTDPHISSQPSNVTTTEGGGASFNIVADGFTPPTYQWFTNGVAVTPGGTASTLNLANIPFVMNGTTVKCTVTTPNGSLDSSAAILTVNHNGPPSPYSGEPVLFTLVSAMGSPFFGNPVQGWTPYDVSYYPLVEVNTNFAAGVASGAVARIVFNLAETKAPQVYKVPIMIATQNTNAAFKITMGDATWVTNVDWPNTLVECGPLSSGISFSNITIDVFKVQPSGTLQNYWIAGCGTVQTNYARIPGINNWVNADPILNTNNNPNPGNLVPNSSFELGFQQGGWTSGRNGTPQNEWWLANMRTNTGFDGNYAAVIGDGLNASRFALYSPPIWLDGERSIREYCLSFYYRFDFGSGGASVDWSQPYGGAVSGSANFNVTAGWQRFQTNLWLKPYPTRIFNFNIHQGTGNRLFVDAVQFEESTNGASAYHPADPVEMSILGMIDGPQTLQLGNMVPTNFNRRFLLSFYNSTGAPALNRTVRIRDFDWQNRLPAETSFLQTIPPGNSQLDVGIGSLFNGSHRLYAWMDNSPSFVSEAEYAAVPFPATTKTTNSMFGSHAINGQGWVQTNAALGIKWQSGLSPGSLVRWNAVEGTQGVFDWSQTDLTMGSATNDAFVLPNLSNGTNSMPGWALTNSPNFFPRLDAWSNWVWAVVSRYKIGVHYWEDVNEPSSQFSVAQFALLEQVTAQAVKVADPTAYYVAFGGIGEGTDISYATNVWNLLDGTTRGRIDAASTHMYPANKDLWMGPDDDPRPMNAALLGTVINRPVWNTESGVFHWSGHGDRNGGLQGTISYADHNIEFNYWRSLNAEAELTSRNWIRLLGSGVKKYFYYDGRVGPSDGYSQETALPTMFEYDDSLNPIGAAYLWSAYFLDNPSYVNLLTNASTSDAWGSLFAHTNSGSWQVIPTFTLSRSNVVLTLPDSRFAVFDLMGNELQTNSFSVLIGRMPVYIASADMTSNQLAAAWSAASAVQSVSVTAPYVSIDSSAFGFMTPTNKLPLRFRWTVTDDVSANTDDTPLWVTTRFRFYPTNTWSIWSAKRYTELAAMPTNQTRVEVQSQDINGNISGVFVGPWLNINSTNVGSPSLLRINGRTKQNGILKIK